MATHSTPVFLPGESHGRRSLVGYSPQRRKESDPTERLNFHVHNLLYIFIFFYNTFFFIFFTIMIFLRILNIVLCAIQQDFALKTVKVVHCIQDLMLCIHSMYNSLHVLAPDSYSIPLPEPYFLATTSLLSMSMVTLFFYYLFIKVIVSLS